MVLKYSEAKIKVFIKKYINKINFWKIANVVDKIYQYQQIP